MEQVRAKYADLANESEHLPPTLRDYQKILIAMSLTNVLIFQGRHNGCNVEPKQKTRLGSIAHWMGEISPPVTSFLND